VASDRALRATRGCDRCGERVEPAAHFAIDPAGANVKVAAGAAGVSSELPGSEMQTKGAGPIGLAPLVEAAGGESTG
jgi:hypothetical protein